MLTWIKKNRIPSILIFVLTVFIAIQILRPNIGKNLLDKFNSDLRNKNKILKGKLDSLERQKQLDSIFYSELLDDLEAKKKRIQKRVDYANYKLRLYEDAFKDYNTSDFNSNFITFTKFVTSGDTIPNGR